MMKRLYCWLTLIALGVVLVAPRTVQACPA